MKKLLILSLLVIIHLGVYAQNEVFRIDSIPQQGILLDKGWKFHAGDNPDFANPDFDDSKWESIDPTKKMDDLEQLQNVGICWLRIRIKLNPNFENTILSLTSDQIVASEFFVDGKFIGNYGVVGKDTIEYHPQTYLNPVTHFYIGQNTNMVLAVRVARKFYKNELKVEFEHYKLRYLSVRIFETDNKKSTLRNAFLNNNYEYRGNFDANALDYFKTGVFLILCFLHLFFYFNFKEEISNLYFGLACAFLCIFYFYEAIARGYLLDYESFITYTHLFWPLVFIAYSFSLKAVYKIFDVKSNLIFYLLGIASLIIILFDILGNPFPFNYGAVFCILYYLEISRISYIAYKSKKTDAVITLIGSILYVIFLFLFIIYMNIGFDSRIPEHLFANLSYLSLPISITLVLAKSFARTKHKLIEHLSEVNRLSHEKHEFLLKQNVELQSALLKGQTIERQRVAADLHDNLGSTLSALWLNVDMIDKSKMNAEEREIHQNLRENLEKAYNDVRLLSHNLLPEEFEKQGLVSTLQSFVRKISKNSKISFDLQIAEGFGRVDNKIEFELYSICLELVNNIIKHSKASEANISLSRINKQIELIISDNGIGTFNNESDGKGMKNVKDIVYSIGGTWIVKNVESKGVVNEIRI